MQQEENSILYINISSCLTLQIHNNLKLYESYESHIVNLVDI